MEARAAVFVAVAVSFQTVWTFNNWQIYGTPFYNQYWGHAIELTRATPLPLRVRLLFLPGALISSLTPALAFFSFWGLCSSVTIGRRLRCAILAFAICAFIASNVLRQNIPSFVRYAFVASTLLLPYAGIGLDRLIGLVPGYWERYVLVGVVVLSIPIFPYLNAWSGAEKFDLRPIPRADNQTRQIIEWLQTHSRASDYWMLDFMGWREQYILYATNHFDRAWVLGSPDLPGASREIPLTSLVEFVRVNHPKYFIFDQQGRLAGSLEVPCPDQLYQPILGAKTAPVFSVDSLTVCELTYQ